VNGSAKYVTAIVVTHLLVNIAHGFAHNELRVGLAAPASIVVIVVVLIVPLIATGLVWTAKKRLGLISLVAFDVRIIAVRSVSPFSDR
jgi:hypothetical protein